MSGKTEDEAILEGLKQLGKEREDVSVEIVERAKGGFLGIGAANAVVRLSYEETESKSERAVEFLKGLFARMEVDAEPRIVREDDDVIAIEIVGDSVGPLIGRRGDTLDAIQHLANYAVNHGGGDRVRVSIDAENYREKRENTLRKLAEKVAAKAVHYRRNVTLEPMNAYERHIIHAALQDYDGVTTYSTGTEPNRRIVVAYEGKEQPSQPQQAKPTFREWG